jgi:hypothetical protein
VNHTERALRTLRERRPCVLGFAGNWKPVEHLELDAAASEMHQSIVDFLSDAPAEDPRTAGKPRISVRANEIKRSRDALARAMDGARSEGLGNLSAWVAAKNAVDKEKDGKYSERWQRDGLNVRYDAPDDAPPPDVPAAKPPPAAASNSTAAPDAASTTQQSSRLGSMMKPWSRSKQKSAE